MHVSTTISEWLERRAALEGRLIGVVPTMGALHRGHAALVERCKRENEVVTVTLFVNPAQFNDPADLQRYPRTMDADLALLAGLGTDEVFAPSAGELYPNGYALRVVNDSFAKEMEGRCRPGFFEGVMTVVLKLLNLIRGGRAYFGEKDYQQWKVLHEMALELFLPTEIRLCPTIRAASGLAESSRNALLSPQGREQAAVIYRALTQAVTAAEARAELESARLRVDYVEEHWGRRFAAAYLEGIRLIDNVPLENAKCSSAST